MPRSNRERRQRGAWRTPPPAPAHRTGAPRREASTLAAVLIVLVLLGTGLVGGALAQSPGASPSTTPMPSAGVPGATPGTPAVWLEFDVTLPDLLEGMLKMESAGLHLAPEQVRTMKPALEREEKAFDAMDGTEKVMRRVLSEGQWKVVEEAQTEGALKVDLGEGRPDRPGEDPLISRVLEILEKKSSTQDGQGNR